ncbi:hypothetical protein [Shimia sediminis]|uniref:hypothetical protein n=1 Tax=Shimia sediminis TaxID=2497945 RepID=UPI0013DF9C6D|nr:hypothetical protein [Shimia sediminis]
MTRATLILTFLARALGWPQQAALLPVPVKTTSHRYPHLVVLERHSAHRRKRFAG